MQQQLLLLLLGRTRGRAQRSLRGCEWQKGAWQWQWGHARQLALPLPALQQLLPLLPLLLLPLLPPAWLLTPCAGRAPRLGWWGQQQQQQPWAVSEAAEGRGLGGWVLRGGLRGLGPPPGAPAEPAGPPQWLLQRQRRSPALQGGGLLLLLLLLLLLWRGRWRTLSSEWLAAGVGCLALACQLLATSLPHHHLPC